MDDRELLELAAKAAGMRVSKVRQAERDAMLDPKTASLWIIGGNTAWNPITDDSDAFRLAVKLDLLCDTGLTGCLMKAACEEDPAKAVRRVFVEAAALIGRQMEVAGE